MREGAPFSPDYFTEKAKKYWLLGTSYRRGSSNTGSSLRGNAERNRTNIPKNSVFDSLQSNAESEEITKIFKTQGGGPGGVFV
jgi:hypothetical protein